jgi:hypothetical protein|tara:strand:+ start:551 stop:769 length:219 start_codon:yes stop_codon:yes gene_type:complete
MMTNKLMTIPEYLKHQFAPGSAPSVYTVRNWINQGKIKGVKMGGVYYIANGHAVSYAYENPTANLVNRVLNS